MKIPATPIALAAFSLGMMIVPAAAADRDMAVAATTQVALQPAASPDVAALVVQRCLLPGQIRSFGGLTMLTPRRLVALAADDCTARGGEPIASTAATD